MSEPAFGQPRTVEGRVTLRRQRAFTSIFWQIADRGLYFAGCA